jgi:hypothetical protein
VITQHTAALKAILDVDREFLYSESDDGEPESDNSSDNLSPELFRRAQR